MRPPRLAVLMMRVLLPPHLREAIAGDLEEEWNRSARPSRRAFWSLALRSIAACAIGRLRRPRLAPRGAVMGERPRKGDGLMPSLLQDVRHGWRLLWRSPGFTAAAVVTLALGIGANSAIFSLVNVFSLKALPYHEPSRVAFLLGRDAEDGLRFNLRLADYVDLKERARSLEAVTAYTYLSANLTGGDLPERVQAYRVTPDTFAMLGVAPALGRVFEASDAQEGRDDVVVLSDGLWHRLFAGEASVLGRRVTLNGRPHEVVGVMPARFEFPVFNFKGDLWVPWGIHEARRGEPAAGGGATLVARLRDGYSYTQAQSEIDTLMQGFAEQHPDTNRGMGARLIEMGKLDDEQAGPAMAIVMATAGVVLLLACANVANLLLARGVSRSRELAVRAALGASAWRLGRQLLAEGVILALLGGLAGTALAVWGVRAMRAALPEMIYQTTPLIDELAVDRATLGYTLALSLLTSFVFGALPAWRAARPDFQDGLRENASAGGSRGTRRLRSTLVIAEVALSALLLVAAGLLVRSYGSLQRVNPGFSPHGVVTMALSLPEYKYAEPQQRLLFSERVLEAVARVPGAQAAGFVNVLPFSTYDNGRRMVVDGASPPEPGREPSVSYRVASPGYLEALGIPVVEGRSFEPRDRAEGEAVAIVNRTLARRFLEGRSPLGRRVRLGDADSPWITVVGMVGDVHHSQLSRTPDPEIYVPLPQAPPSQLMLAVRVKGRPEALIRPVRAAIQAVDPAQPVYHVKTMDQLVRDSMLANSTAAVLMLLFSALALSLAAVGVYGVIAYGVSQQTREFGLRIALGATRRDVLSLVLRHGVRMVGAGVALGAAGALAVARLMGGALHGVGPADPLTYAAVVALLMLTGVAAACVPAWRASRVEPITALRVD